MESQGEFFAGKLMDLANMAMAALVFAEVASKQRRLESILIGASFFLSCAMVSYLLRIKKREDRLR